MKKLVVALLVLSVCVVTLSYLVQDYNEAQDLIDELKELKKVREENDKHKPNEINPKPNEAMQKLISRCRSTMGEYGSAMVKACVDQDIEAENALRKY
jgi:mannitol-specific phosphotransferase system IIBC component